MIDLVLDDTSLGENLSPFGDVNAVSYNPEYADEKAEKYSLVLGDKSPGADIIRNSIDTGENSLWDTQIALAEDVRNTQQRNNLIQEVAINTTGRNPTTDEINLVMGLSDDQLFKPDVSTALERNYSKSYTTLVSSLPSNVVAEEAFAEDEESSMEVLDRAQSAQTRALLANDAREAIEKEYNDTGYFTRGVAWAKQLVPGYTWYKQRNNVPGASAWLTGNNLQEQITMLYNMPPDKFKSTLKAVLDNLKSSNIQEARDFANAVVSYGTSEQNLGNIFDLADLASLVPSALSGAGKLAKGMSKTAKAVVGKSGDLAEQAAKLGMNREAAIATLGENVKAGDI